VSTEEIDIWSETASMRDFYVNPRHWLLSVLTLGIYAGVVYLNRYYTRYRLTNERLVKVSGLLARRIDEIELYRIRDTRLHQTFFQRLVGMGSVDVVSTDVSESFQIEHLPQAHEKREQIRAMANKAREGRGMRTVLNE